MTPQPPREKRTAEEVADRLVGWFYENSVHAKALLTEHLKFFAEEARDEGFKAGMEAWQMDRNEAYEKGYADAQEAVAKVLEGDVLTDPLEFEGKTKLKVFDLLERIAAKIRALRSEAGQEEKLCTSCATGSMQPCTCQ